MARRVALHVPANGGLCDRERGKMPDDDAEEQDGNEPNEPNISRN